MTSKKTLSLIVAAALAGGGIYFARHLPSVSNAFAQTTAPEPSGFTPASGPLVDPTDVPDLVDLSEQYARLVKAVRPSVVSISTSRHVDPRMLRNRVPYGMPYGMPQGLVQNALGSGVIVSKEGHVLTNNHVVSGFDEILVKLSDGREIVAKLLGVDPPTDLAVLKIEAEELQPLPFGDSDLADVGEVVLAIGNPLGLEETVTRGIISAKGRTAEDGNNISEMIQTDASINQGNSGGPLINMQGELVGINTMIASQTGGSIGIGFAVPSNTAMHALNSLLEYGKVFRGQLGVTIQGWTPQLVRQFNREEPTGALVSSITPGSPAQEAGIQRGDIIEKFNGREVEQFSDLKRLVLNTIPGENVSIEVTRRGQPITLNAEIRSPDARAIPTAARAQPNRAQEPTSIMGKGILSGVEVAELNDGLRQQLGVGSDVQGVVVMRVQPNTPAAASLQRGDVIEAINQDPVTTPAEFATASEKANQANGALLSVNRGGAESFVAVAP